MAPTIVTVTNEKGGVGKTTTVVSLAQALAQRGKRILVIDLDAQMNLTFWIGTEPPAATIYTALRQEQATPLGEAVTSTVIPGVDLVQGDRKLGLIDSELAQFNRPVRRLRTIVRGYEGLAAYDYVFIDSAPGVGRLLLNAMVAADRLLIPCTASALALEGVEKITRSVDQLSAGEEREISIEMPMRVLFTLFRPTTKVAQAAQKRVVKRFGIEPYRTHIRQSIRAAEAPDFHQTLASYDPSGTIVADYNALAEEFLADA